MAGLRERVSAQQSVTFIICGACKRAGMGVYSKSVDGCKIRLHACMQGWFCIWQPALYERCRAIARNANAGRIARARKREAIRTFINMWCLQNRRHGCLLSLNLNSGKLLEVGYIAGLVIHQMSVCLE